VTTTAFPHASLHAGPRPAPLAAAGLGGAAASAEHPWMLVAPWWHWPTQPSGHGRTSHPALQKYETSDLVNTFLADPQLRLEFQTAVDEFVQVTPAPSPMGVPTRTPTGVRKLYLDTHHRHYLVTCELHCDATGFPQVTRDQVCQAGFVVRRRSYDLTAETLGAARRLLRRLAGANQRLAASEKELVVARTRRLSAMQLGQLEARREAAAQLVAQHQSTVRQWAAGIGIERRLEGWIPQGKQGNAYVDVPSCPEQASAAGVAPLSGVGRWASVEEMPDELSEAWYPMSPLIADPTDPASDAAGATIYFGLVRTGSGDLDQSGTARYDDDSCCEIRCFVRRHKPACPLTGPQCHCPIVWSDPSESYRLASHFDVQGTANKPVTVQLPDLVKLQSDALSLPLGSTGGVIMKAPQSLMPLATFPPGGSQAAGEICSFSIPLITIVATFVFKLFLPVVILAFQLWFMLLLKFCIPPEVSVGAGLAAALQAVPPSMQVSAGFEATWGGAIDAAIDQSMNGANLGNGSASQVLKNGPATDRIRLAKMLFSGPVSPLPPSDLIFAAHVDRASALP
jgi:hypothetical protein